MVVANVEDGVCNELTGAVEGDLTPPHGLIVIGAEGTQTGCFIVFAPDAAAGGEGGGVLQEDNRVGPTPPPLVDQVLLQLQSFVILDQAIDEAYVLNRWAPGCLGACRVLSCAVSSQRAQEIHLNNTLLVFCSKEEKQTSSFKHVFFLSLFFITVFTVSNKKKKYISLSYKRDTFFLCILTN